MNRFWEFRFGLLPGFILLFVLWFGGCADDKRADSDTNDPPVIHGDRSDCQGCHTSREMLQATVDPSSDPTPPPGTGEG